MKMKLIDKSKVVAEIKSLMRTTFTNFDEGVNCAAQTLLEIIDTLEVKEVEEIPVSNDLEEAATKYARKQLLNPDYPTYNDEYEIECAFEAGAQWQKENLWKPADGDDLPEINREVIALIDNGMVVFAHRPPEYWDGKNILTGKVTRHEPKRYDKGGWNIPDVKWWLDLDLPKMQE